MGLGRPRFELSRLRIKEPRLNIVPLSVDEVARFWSSFRNARDLAIVGLMLMHGLRSVEVMALNRDDVLLSEGQLRVRGKGNKLRLLPLAPETTQLLDHYLRVERPDPCSAALFVVLKGPARGQRITPAGLGSCSAIIAALPVSSWQIPTASDTRSPPIWCAPASAYPH